MKTVKIGNTNFEASAVALGIMRMAGMETADAAKTLETAVDRMQQVILLGRQKRLLETIKVKTPLSRCKKMQFRREFFIREFYE